MGNKNITIAALDIGTTKTSCIIADYNESGVELIGYASSESKGMRQGEVLNPDATRESVRDAVANAQIMAGCTIKDVIVSISGEHVYGTNSNGMVPLKEDEVKEKSVHDVIEAAAATPTIRDRAIVHVLPQVYEVDHKTLEQSPVGVSGVRLDAWVHVVSAGKDSYDNLLKCVSDCGLHVDKVVAGPVASSHAVATKEEKELGVAVIDIGGGTTDLAIYDNGALVHSEVISIAGRHLTSDLKMFIKSSFEEAERLKICHATAINTLESRKKQVQVSTIANRPPSIISVDDLSRPLQARLFEHFQLLWDRIYLANMADKIRAGIIITGGTSQMLHLPICAEKAIAHAIKHKYPNLRVPSVRNGTPRDIVGGLIDAAKDPRYATAVGLILYAIENNDFAAQMSRYQRNKSGIKGFFCSVRDQILALF